MGNKFESAILVDMGIQRRAVQFFGVSGMDSRRSEIRSKMDSKLRAGKAEFVPRKESTTCDPLSVDLCPVCTPQVPNEQKSVGSCDRAVELGDAVMGQNDVTKAWFSTHESDISGDQKRLAAIDGNQLGNHRKRI